MTNSPGVGVYTPQGEQLLLNNPKYSVKKEKRVCPIGTYNYHTAQTYLPRVIY
jgi:hypothetical protein